MKKTLRNIFSFATVALLLGSSARAQVVTTVASGASTFFEGILVGTLDTVYFYDGSSSKLKKLDPLGAITSFVGSGSFGSTDGTGAGASFGDIYGMVFDGSGNIFALDYGYGNIRKITPAGVVTTFTTGFSGPLGLVWGNADTLIVLSYPTGSITKVAPSGTTVAFATVPGSPGGITKGNNDTLYASGFGSNKIYRIDPLGTVTTLAGSGAAGSTNGTGAAATFNSPAFLVADGAGNLFVSDNGNHIIRQVTPAGVVTTFAGSGTAATTDGTGAAASFNQPWTIAISPTTGNFFITQRGSGGNIRMMSGGVPLPLSWLALSAQLSSKGNAQIQWEVNEKDVKNYTLQKSTDGTQYMPIGNVVSKGNGEQKYSYTEPSALYGTAYYRIQQVDMDGKSTFSASLKLNNSDVAASQSLKVYPTQFSEGFSISSTTAQSAQLINNLGQVVQTINIVAGEQYVSVAALAAGIYYVKSENGSVQRIVKL